MPKVVCKLPNATSPINGFKFVTHRDGMISEELEDAVAKKFATIPGYEIHDPAPSAPIAKKEPQQPTKEAIPANVAKKAKLDADPGSQQSDPEF